MTAEQRARELIVFCDGIEEAGMTVYAARARMVARDVLELTAEVESARSAANSWKTRHEEYVAYHHSHCFNRDGTSKAA